jgi:hypothetical protein
MVGVLSPNNCTIWDTIDSFSVAKGELETSKICGPAGGITSGGFHEIRADRPYGYGGLFCEDARDFDHHCAKARTAVATRASGCTSRDTVAFRNCRTPQLPGRM